MLIDSHVHIDKVSGKQHGTYSDLDREMKRSRIDKAVVISDFCSTETRCDTNEIMKIASHDKRLAIVGGIDMERFTMAAIRHLGAMMKKKIIRGVKIYPGYQYVYPNDRKLYPLFRLCQKYDFPLLIHSGDTYREYRGVPKIKFSHPIHVDDIAADFPRLKIVIAHLGNPWTIDAAEVIYKNKNVYGDISGFFLDFSSKRYNRLAAAKINEAIAYCETAKKFLFGTDWPLIGIKEYLNFMLKNLDITADEKSHIFHKNATKIFRL